MILIAGFMFWVFAFNATISSVLALILDNIAGLLDTLTKIFGTLPFSSSGNINTGIYELLVIYSLIFSLVIYFRTRRVIGLYLTLICTLLIFSKFCLDEFRQTTHKEVMVLSLEGITAINLISGSQNVILTDDTSQLSRAQIGLHCINYWHSADLEDPEFIQIRNDKNRHFADEKLYLSGYQRDKMLFIQFCDMKIGILSDCYLKESKTEVPLKLDLLIINAICPIDIATVMVDIKPDRLVIDRQVPPWSAEKIEMACILYGVPVHNVYRQGYFKLEL
jgi:hypothetical protein